MVVAVTALLETTKRNAQRLLHLLLDKEDAVQVIGHHLEGDDLDFGMVQWCRPPLVSNTLPQF